MPVTVRGNPQNGLFPYVSGDITGATYHEERVTIASDFVCPALDLTLAFAAHATMRRLIVGTDEYVTQTGWSEGPRITENGAWATSDTLTLTCDCSGGGGGVGEDDCETAYAYGGEDATCFVNAPAGFFEEEFKRWGWTNGPLNVGSYEFVVYAGAGQCDRDKGVDVGYVTVDYGDENVNVQFTIDVDEWFMTEFQLFVSDEKVPRLGNGKQTVGPGAYTIVDEAATGVSTRAYSLPATGDDIYVIAHAVVCTPGTPGV